MKAFYDLPTKKLYIKIVVHCLKSGAEVGFCPDSELYGYFCIRISSVFSPCQDGEDLI